MKLPLLKEHIENYVNNLKNPTAEQLDDLKMRKDRVKYYKKFTTDKILQLSNEDLTTYISKLWAMLIWGNKQYYVDKLIDDNGFENFKEELAELIWGNDSIDKRWDRCRDNIKGLGPAMISELLCHVHPNDCIIWNRRAYVGLDYLGFDSLPRYNYQLTGNVYKELIEKEKIIAEEIKSAGLKESNLLTVDYFIWDELQVEKNLSTIFSKHEKSAIETKPTDTKTYKSIHNEVRDAIRDIGSWLGFDASIEKKVAAGSKVDVIWEQSIGNMGRIIYVFEVQSKGSIDSLILNLFKSLNNPAVQGVVAVSDKDQLEKIKMHAENVGDLNKKLRYWDYEFIFQIRDSLEFVNAEINKLGLVPEGF